MELTIENTGKFYNSSYDWYQAWLIIGEAKQEIGRSYFVYDDCRLNCEKLVKEFAKQGIQVVHDKIYELSVQRLAKAEDQIRQKDSQISFLLGEIKEALNFIPENCSAARLLTDALLDEAGYD